MKVRCSHNYERQLSAYSCACGSTDHCVLIYTYSNDEEACWCQAVFLNEGWWDRIRCFFRYVFLAEEWTLGTWILSDTDQEAIVKRLSDHISEYEKSLA